MDQAIAYIRDQQQANTGPAVLHLPRPRARPTPRCTPRRSSSRSTRASSTRGGTRSARRPSSGRSSSASSRRTPCCRRANPGVQAWADLNDNQKKVYCRLQEVFAGFLDHADHHLGRLFAALDEMGIRDNTLIMVVSDNGASQEGLQNGTLNTDRYRNYFPDTVEEMLGKLDEAGGPSTDPHYPMGWAMAGNAPLKRWKQDTHAGGNTDPFIVSWPAKIKDNGCDPQPVPPHRRRGPDDSRSDRPARAGLRQRRRSRCRCTASSMAYSFTDGAREDPEAVAVLRDARQPGHLGRRLEGRDLAQEGHALGRRQVGALPHRRGLHRVERPRRDATRRSSRSCRSSGWRRRRNTTSCRSTTAATNAPPIRRRPVAAIAKKQLHVLSRHLDPAPARRAAVARPGAYDHGPRRDLPSDGAEGVLACSGGEFGGWTLFLKDGKFHYVHNYLKLDEFSTSHRRGRSRRASTR